MFLFTFLIVLLLQFIGETQQMTDGIGPADIQIEGIEPCDDASIYKDPYDITFTKKNRTHVAYTACYLFPSAIDKSSYMLNVTAAKWGDGGWKPNAFDYVSYDMCNNLMANVETLWKSILQAFGAEEKCPVPAGKYCVDALIAPLDNMFPSMLYGRFRTDIMIHVNQKPLLCFRVFVTSTRSKNKKF